MKKLLITIIISCLTTAVSEAATYYVAKTGSNSNTCAQAQSQSTPKLTVGAGASCLLGGDTLYIKAGTYSEPYNGIKLPSGISWAGATIISNFGTDVVTFQSSGNPFSTFGYALSYVIFNGFIYDGVGTNFTTGGIATGNGSHHIRWINVEVKNWGANGVSGGGIFEFINCNVHDNGKMADDAGHPSHYGFYLANDGNLIDHCEIHHNGGYGLHLYNVPGGVNNNTIRNSIVHDNSVMPASGQANILLSSGNNNAAYNNIVYGGFSGIEIGTDSAGNSSCTNCKVYNNTIYGVAYWAMHTPAGSVNAIIKNNIMYNNGSDIFDRSSIGTVKSNNLFNATNPLFVNAAARDFRLQSGSPARTAGVDLFLQGVITDLAGVARPQGCCFDIGAYQYGSQSTPPSNLMAPTNLIAGP
jgi:hypothetical protein